MNLILLLAFGLMLGAGCVRGPSAKAFPPPPSEEVRAHWGTIGLVRRGNLTNSLLQTPMTRGAATAAGAGMGALWGLSAGAAAGGGGGTLGGLVAVIVWSVTVPVGTIVGAEGGNREGMPVLERHRAEGQLHKAVLETDVQRLLNDELLRVIREKTRESVVSLDSDSATRLSEPTASFSATNGVASTFMEVSVLSAGLSGGWDRSSPLAAFLEVRVRLARASDGADLYAHTWVPHSGSATFEKWAADEAQAIRQELPRMIAPLAESVVDEVFLVYDPKQAGKRR